MTRHYPTGAGVLDQNASSLRVNFKRLKDQLAERRLIGEWNSLVWAARSTQTEGKDR